MDIRVEHFDGSKVVVADLVSYLREGDSLKVVYSSMGFNVKGIINMVKGVTVINDGVCPMKGWYKHTRDAWNRSCDDCYD